MQPPPPIDFISTEAVRQLYAAMPTVFARDIARAKGQLIPPQSMPTLKRERPMDGPELAMKRRDTGESKASTGMPPPATPSLVPKSVPISTQSFPGGIPQGAMPDRARMAQMRQQQAQLQAQSPPAQQPHASTGVRQMSPAQSSNAGVGIGVGASAGVGQPQGQPQVQGQGQAAAMQQVVNSFGQQGLAFIQQLQDPNSAFVKYMVEQIPSFMTLPLQQQLESMQQAQVGLPLIFCPILAHENMSHIAHDSAETTCPATNAAAAAAAIPTPATAIAAAAAAATATATTAAAPTTTNTTSTNATAATQPAATAAAKHE